MTGEMAHATRSLPHGLLSGRFEIRKTEGMGGSCRVFRAFDRLTQQTVAIKLLHDHLFNSVSHRARFVREVEFCKDLRHPHILSPLELFVEDDRAYYSMELLEGGSLKDRILLGGRLSPDELMELVMPLLAALEYAHERGIIHGDIKPQNILFRNDGTPLLSDFGLARQMAREDDPVLEASGSAPGPTPEVTTGAGTADYAPAELFLGGSGDQRSDLYSFAASMFEALCAELPYPADSPRQSAYLHSHAPLPDMLERIKITQTEKSRSKGLTISSPLLPLRDLTRGEEDTIRKLQPILNKALAKEPINRYCSAAELRDDICKLNPPARVPALQTMPCPSCGADMFKDFPLCAACGGSARELSAPRRRKPFSRLKGTEPNRNGLVLVTGPGKAGDRMNLQLRHQMLQCLRIAGLHVQKLEKQVPRLPFVAAHNMASEDARKLGVDLSRAGLQVRQLDISRKEARRGLRRALFAKLAALYPRILLIALSFMGGIWYQIPKAPLFFLPILGSVFLLIVPAALLASSRSAISHSGDGPGAGWKQELLQIGEGLSQPGTRSVIQRIAMSLDLLERQGSDGQELMAMREQVLSQCRSLADLDIQLQEIRTAGGDPENESQFEQLIQRILDILLKRSLTLDRLRLGNTEYQLKISALTRMTENGGRS